MISISIDPVNFELVVNALAPFPNKLRKVTRSAIQKSVTAGKREIKTKAKARYTLPSSIVSSSLKSRVSASYGEIKSTGKRNRLELAKTKMTTGGLYALVVRSQGGLIPRSFINPRTGLFSQRLGKPRYPIRTLTTVSAPNMAGHNTVANPAVNKITEILNREIMAKAASIL